MSAKKLVGKNPPVDINVIDKLKLSNNLIPEIFKNKKTIENRKKK